jgi:hypothetical protein
MNPQGDVEVTAPSAAYLDGDAVLLLLNAPAAAATTNADPKTMPTIGPGRWYQGFAAAPFFLSLLAGAVPPSAGAAKRTFRREVPGSRTLSVAAS